jgi:hypothetical protein
MKFVRMRYVIFFSWISTINTCFRERPTKRRQRTWVYGTHFDLGDKLTKKIAVCDEIVSIKKYESYKLTLKNKRAGLMFVNKAVNGGY